MFTSIFFSLFFRILWDSDGQILSTNQDNGDNTTFIESIKKSLIFFDNLNVRIFSFSQKIFKSV